MFHDTIEKYTFLKTWRLKICAAEICKSKKKVKSFYAIFRLIQNHQRWMVTLIVF